MAELLTEIGPDYGKGGAIVLRHFDGEGKNVYRPGMTISPEEIVTFPPMNRFRLVRAGYIRLIEEKGDELSGDVMRLSQDKKALEARVAELEKELAASRRECEALRGAIHGDEVPTENGSKELTDEEGKQDDEAGGQYDGLSTDELKHLCKDRGLKGYGNSSDEKLIERLIEHDKRNEQ